jgi:hypothetical protein
LAESNLLNTTASVNPSFPDPIPNVIPFGSICLFAGAPKRGKTTLIAQWAVRWREGKDICGLHTNQLPDFAVITNDHKWAINQGIWFAKAGWPDVKHYSMRDDKKTEWGKLRTPNGRADLLRHCLDKVQIAPGGLVVLDVVGPFLTNKINDYNEVLAGLGVMSQILDEYQVSVLAPAHMGKQKGNNSQEQYKEPHERILGSGAQIGFCDTTFYLLGPKDLDTDFYQVGWLPTHAPAGEFNLTRDPDTGLFIPHDLQETGTKLGNDRLGQFLGLIPDDGIGRGELETLAKEQFRVGRTTVHRDLEKLKQHRLIIWDEWGHIRRRKPS